MTNIAIENGHRNSEFFHQHGDCPQLCKRLLEGKSGDGKHSRLRFRQVKS